MVGGQREESEEFEVLSKYIKSWWLPGGWSSVVRALAAQARDPVQQLLALCYLYHQTSHKFHFPPQRPT